MKRFSSSFCVDAFMATLSVFDLQTLCHLFTVRGLFNRAYLERALIHGELYVHPEIPSASLNLDLDSRSSSQASVTGQTTFKPQAQTRSLITIRSDIKLTLRQIVDQERIEAALLEKQYQQKGAYGKGLAHINHFANGLYASGTSFLTWLKDVDEVLSLNKRLLRVIKAAMAAEQDNHGQRYQVFKQTVAESEKKELVEALGFDPANISVEKFKQVYSLANVIYDDPLTRIILTQFVKDFADAQHSLEWSEFSGGAAFEVILTALLAMATGGVGAIASLGSQARKMSQLKKLGALLSELAERLKDIPASKPPSLRKMKEEENRKTKQPQRHASDKPAAKQQKSDVTKDANNFSKRKEDVVQDQKLNPLKDPKVAKQIKEDSTAIYGYSPKAGKGLDQFGIDFSDPKQVADAREKRIEYLENLEKKKAALAEEVSTLQKNGMSLEDIARLKVEQRNQNRIDSYLQTDNLDGLKSMQERNLIEYGRKEGPTADQLFEKKGSWENVVFGSVKSSKAMDVLLGLD